MAWTTDRRVITVRDRWTLADLTVETLDGFRRHQTARNAAALAYYGFFTLFPLVMAGTTILGMVLEDDPTLVERIIDSALGQIPLVGDQLETTGELSGDWPTLIIGLVLALWGSLKAFVGIQTALDDCWEVDIDHRSNVALKRAKALIGVFVIGIGQVIGVVLAAIVSQALLPLEGQVLIVLGSVTLNFVMVILVYRYLTSRSVTWAMLWRGALVCAFLYTALQLVGTTLLTRMLRNAQAVYGAYYGTLALLTWLTLLAYISLIGGELNAALQRRRERGGPPESESASVIESQPSAIMHLFVYGTLRPGDVRWPLLAPFVADTGVDDSVAGELFDTGLDYPAAVFGGDGTILGRTYELRADRLDEALAVLDEEEDTVAGLYRRVEVVTGAGTPAWAYAYGTGLDLTPIPTGDWFHRT